MKKKIEFVSATAAISHNLYFFINSLDIILNNTDQKSSKTKEQKKKKEEDRCNIYN